MGAIEDSFSGLGEQIGKIPHVVIGGTTKKKQMNSPYYSWKQEKNKNYFKEDPMDAKIDKIKKWMLLICILLIVGYASYRILEVILSRMF
jgi:hypothetical protein